MIVSNEAGEPTLRAQAQAAKEKLTDGVQADPRVQAVMSRFPGTQLVEVRAHRAGYRAPARMNPGLSLRPKKTTISNPIR